MQEFNYEFLKLDFKGQQDFSLSENIMWSTSITPLPIKNNKAKKEDTR